MVNNQGVGVLVKNDTKLLSIFAFIGTIFMIVGTFLHPMHADPNVPVDAFHEYVESTHWIAIHLLQLFGFIFITGTMVLLFLRLQTDTGKDWVTLGMAGRF